MNLDEIQDYVRGKLSEKRFYHSMCVRERSGEIAERLGADVEKAKKIGMAHDVAKEMTELEKFEYVRENNIEVDEIERINSGLLHAKIGEHIAVNKFGFTADMGHAIRCHTTGAVDMDIYAKILFVADRTSADREYEYTDTIKELLNESIDKAILFIFDEKIRMQLKKGQAIHLDGILARNWLICND